MPKPIAQLVPSPPYSADEIERFLERIPRRPVGRSLCWEWQGTRDRKGYGLFRLRTPMEPLLVRVLGTTEVLPVKRRQRTPIGAHRFAHEIWVGPVGDKIVCHRCDNPGCVRPTHLVAGSYADNSADMGRKRRHPTIGKMNPRKVRRIRRLASQRVRQREIARRFGVSQPAISNIVNRRTWKEVL